MSRFGWGILLLLAVAVPLRAGRPGPDPLLPASSGGIEVVDRAFRQLATHRRLLIIGAHPDDEDNRLLTLVATGLGGEAAYLSLSRGEGGQNLLGSELGVALGLVRTGESLSARRLEGSQQFFARAFDFGYTRSLEETFGRWPREVLRRDAVRVVRRFKPQVIVAIFPADERAGHGQHQASAVIAADVMELAGLPDRYPQMTESGLPPWQAQVLYRSMWWNPDAGEVSMPLDAVNPISGKSVLQLAGSSRSMHRSQDMGQMQELGPNVAKLSWVAGDVGEGGSDIFDGIDTRLAGIADVLQPGALRTDVEGALRRIESLAMQGHGRLSPVHLERSAEELAKIATALQGVRHLLALSPDPGASTVSQLIAEKIEAAERGLVAAAGVFLEAAANRESVIPREDFQAEAFVWTTGRSSVRVGGVQAVSAVGWQSVLGLVDAGDVGEDSFMRWRFDISVPQGSRPTSPSFLTLNEGSDLYDWSDVPFQRLGEPLDLHPLTMEFDLEIEGWPMMVSREVVFRYADQAYGEVRRPLRAVPALEITVRPALTLWSIGKSKSSELEVVVRSNRHEGTGGTVQIEMATNWTTTEPLPFRIDEPFGTAVLQVSLRAPDDLSMGTFRGVVAASTEEGERYAYSLPVVDYEHIRPAAHLENAAFEIRSFSLALPTLDRVGYIRGAADQSPEVLSRTGLPLEILAPQDLATEDLSRFDAIIVGPRAYEVHRAVAAANHRLLEFARRGGLLLVQYQQYQFVEQGYAPFRLEISRPHDRITDESSPVRVLDLAHPVFNTPNRLQQDDWEDWVQERGLYFAHTWSDEYQPLLAMQDPAQAELQGGLLVAPLGEGIYVYTGLSFFRQLPAGVPGALRLMSNLLALADKTDD